MTNLILFDDPKTRRKLLPLAFTKPVAQFRIGIDTIAEKWVSLMGLPVSFLTEKYLSKKFPVVTGHSNLYVNSAYLPNEDLITELNELNENEAIFEGEKLVAVNTSEIFSYPISIDFSKINKKIIQSKPVSIRQLTDIFIYNGKQLEADFQRLTRGLSSQKVADPFTVLYNESNIFICEGASIKSSVLDASSGPIFIGKNTKIEIGSLIQGPFYLGDNSILSLGAKIRPNTTIGPNCKVGGEVSKSVIFGYSNKGHDGFMGCSVIGEWCNWGAGTNNSNLKNDYGLVDMYDYSTQKQEPTGQLFAGLMMGDYCKTAIGTNFNTGTVAGISSNIFNVGFPSKHIPSFTWGGSPTDSVKFRLEKAIQIIDATMNRRNVEITETDRDILTEIFKMTS
jgi:UDP-N-acetylglucosamine diphosphorylase / glucose-1-phosphate thymidylyltransferase / UDP-N-acetylgalactosamine diphosphorylase / glucosamine-1-phosphate N-acetyltransferase / galactosamine-1-phosphate N-acetyltransferase